ncbi:hypothetical protein O181_007897 [Austropuccinia psidii MF-1]|uniref:Integrase catalytic domain-containing protein n=1 Tax=Austropuccinia psidii MF-1 TaxID=1389203 RepID=A0A9Q3BNP7_9BASI|nr:hypothetical protein [Austropuccinia psidii MF-1]
MFNNPSLFTSFTPRTQTIKLADGSTIHATGIGTIKLELHHCFLELKNCLLVKSLAYNLISLGAIMKPNFKIITKENKTFNLLNQNNELILNGTYNTGNFELTVNQNKALAIKTTDQISKTLHQLAGNPSLDYLKKMFPNHNLDELVCTTCSLAKLTKTPFKGHFPIPEQKLQFLHGDLFGPIETPLNSAYKYCLRVMDGYSRYVWVVFLRAKSDVEFHLQKLFNRIECQSNLRISNFVSDNGTEFKNQKLNRFYETKGITHLTTAPYTPQQNPFAERGNRTTITKGRCLLIDSGINQSFWAEAIRTADYLENLTPKKVLNYSTLYNKWFDRPPSYKHLQPFGCKCIFLNNIQQGKFTERGSEGIFLGLDLKINTNNPPLADLEFNNPVTTTPEINSLETEVEYPEPIKEQIPNGEDIPTINENKKRNPKTHYEWIPENCPPPKEIHGEVGDPQNIVNSNQRHKHMANYAIHSINDDPKTYRQAMNCQFSDKWSKAIQTELENMEKHCVWSPITKTTIEGENPLSTTWAFKQKTDENGHLTKFKARLCIRGFHQREGLDYGDVFSPTGRLTSLRLLLTMCHIKRFPVEQMDVKCAFLNGKPDKDQMVTTNFNQPNTSN